MKHPTHYKLTNQDNTTYGNFKWKVGKWYKTNGRGRLCGPGWLHFYTHPILAMFFNPIHANIENPKLWEADVKGKTKDSNGTKCGWTNGRITKEIPLPVITTEQRVEIAIRCAMAVYKDPEWTRWAKNWLNGTDRSAHAAYAAAHAAYDAAHAACSADYAARAADYAAHYDVNILAIIKSVVGEK